MIGVRGLAASAIVLAALEGAARADEKGEELFSKAAVHTQEVLVKTDKIDQEVLDEDKRVLLAAYEPVRKELKKNDLPSEPKQVAKALNWIWRVKRLGLNKTDQDQPLREKGIISTAATLAALKIDSSPNPAEIYIDGIPLGDETDTIAAVAVGDHEIEVRLGSRKASKPCTVTRRGPNRVEIDLP